MYELRDPASLESPSGREALVHLNRLGAPTAAEEATIPGAEPPRAERTPAAPDPLREVGRGGGVGGKEALEKWGKTKNVFSTAAAGSK